MSRKILSFVLVTLTLSASLIFTGTFQASPAPEPNISVVGYFGTDKAQRGRTLQTAIVIDVPSGYHINSNRPLETYLIATQLKVDAPNGVRVGPVTYPRPLLKSFKFSKKKLSVYEGQARLKVTLTIPANYSGSSIELKTNVRLQSCNDEVCFPPKTYYQSMRINVVNATDSVKQVNGWAFR